MQATPNDALLISFRQALAKGDSLSAYHRASHAAGLSETREDWRLAGFWRRQVSLTLHYQGRDDEAIAEAERAAELQIEPLERSKSLTQLSALLTLQGRQNEGLYQLGRADEAACHFPRDTHLKANLHGSKGAAAFVRGDLDQSVLHYETGFHLMIQDGDPGQASSMLNNMGFCLALLRRFGEAERQLLYATELGEKARDVITRGWTSESLGYLYLISGRHRRADLFLTRAVKIFDAFWNKKRLIDSLIYLSEARERLGMTESARRRQRERWSWPRLSSRNPSRPKHNSACLLLAQAH